MQLITRRPQYLPHRVWESVITYLLIQLSSEQAYPE